MVGQRLDKETGVKKASLLYDIEAKREKRSKLDYYPAPIVHGQREGPQGILWREDRNSSRSSEGIKSD
jgi:hypothetical protein